MKKIRIIKKEGKWYVQVRSDLMFSRWKKIDYYFTEADALKEYEKQVEAKGKPTLVKESNWL